MKNCVLKFLIPMLALSISGCSFSGNNQQVPSYTNDDAIIVQPAEIPDDIEVEENVDYYTANDLELSVEVNGLFKSIRYFSLDESNKDLRIYDNMYFYKCDYFQMMPPSSSDDLSIYASLSDENDKQYVEERRNSAGGDLQIDVKVDGIYKLIFDLKTLKFDVEYKSEITTPKYYTIETCTLQVKSGEQTLEHSMTLNNDIFSINNVEISIGSTFYFTAINYVSIYKFTFQDEIENKYACFFLEKEQYKNTYAKALIGGKYNVSINAKTYVVSLELVTDIESATYYLSQNNDPLTPSSEHPYIFEMQYEATKDMSVLPYFYNIALKKVFFVPTSTEKLYAGEEMLFLKKAGSYKLILNVLNMTIDAESL